MSPLFAALRQTGMKTCEGLTNGLVFYHYLYEYRETKSYPAVNRLLKFTWIIPKSPPSYHSLHTLK